MSELTQREAKIAELRGEGLTFVEIAKRLGITSGSARSSWRVARKKNKDLATPRSGVCPVERRDPEKGAAMLDVATDATSDPYVQIEQAAKRCGFPPTTLRLFIRRLKARYQPLNDSIVEVKREELLKLLDDRAWRALKHLDDFALAGAGAKDLAITTGILIEKAQLIKGQPTQILSHAEREKMDDLGKRIIAEMRRRGISIDGVRTTEYAVIPANVPEAIPK